MGKKQCPECGATNSPMAARCSACSAYLSTGNTNSTNPPSHTKKPAPTAGLVPCSECGHQVSPKADACPSCGAPQAGAAVKAATRTAKPNSTSVVSAFIWLVAVIFIGSVMFGGDDEAESERTPRLSSDKPRVEKVLTPAEQREKDIKRQFSAWDGSHRNLERLIKKSLHEPDSYEHVETRYSDKGDHLLVSLKYRARNGFGAMRLHGAVAKVALDGTIINLMGNTAL